MEKDINVGNEANIMKNVDYDPEADAIVLDVNIKKAHHTIEFTEHILIDMSSDGKIVGVEILDASDELSKLFGRAVSKTEIKQLLYQVKQKPDEYSIQFNSPKKNNQVANLLFPVYKSPLIS